MIAHFIVRDIVRGSVEKKSALKWEMASAIEKVKVKAAKKLRVLSWS